MYRHTTATLTGQIFVEGARQYSVMSDTPNNNSGDGSQGEQPQGGQPQGGQPAGGQGGQPQGGQGGGQPPGGQAPGGQAPGGQPPQGGAQGQPQGQAPRGNYQTGPSVTDIFNRQDTQAEIKIGVAIFALVGVGVGLSVFLNGIIADTADPGYVIAAFGYLASFALPPLVSAVVALRQRDTLAEVEQTLRLATAGTTGAAGGFVMVIISTILSIVSLDTGAGASLLGLPEIGDAILPAILVAIASGVTAAGIVWVMNNLLPNGSGGTSRR